MAKQKDLYLVATYYMKPRRGVNTAKAGWKEDPNNMQYDETVAISRGLKDKNRSGAGIVLNLTKKEVERDHWHAGSSFDDLFKYFFKGYHAYVTQVMSTLDPAYFNEMLDEMQREYDASKASESEVITETVNTVDEQVNE